MDNYLDARMQTANNQASKISGQVKQIRIEKLEIEVEELKLKILELENELACRSGKNGRPLKIYEKQRGEIRKLRKEGATLSFLANNFACSKTTIRKICKDIKVDCRYQNDK